MAVLNFDATCCIVASLKPASDFILFQNGSVFISPPFSINIFSAMANMAASWSLVSSK